MMRWIVGSSLKFRSWSWSSRPAMMFFGVDQFRDMPVDVFPEFAPPRVEVQTPCLGLSAAEVEALVTVPLEQALNGVPGSTTCGPSRCRSCRRSSYLQAGHRPARGAAVGAGAGQRGTPTLPTWAARR